MRIRCLRMLFVCQRSGIVDPYSVLVSWSCGPGSILATGCCVWKISAPVKWPPRGVEVKVCGILLHASCLISEFRCLIILHVRNNDAISNIIIDYIELLISYTINMGHSYK